jgi:DNA-binding protein HU-beta
VSTDHTLTSPALTEAVAELAAALATHDEVTVTGLGTLRVQRRAARVVRHPQTGEAVPIAADAVVTFLPDPALRRAIAEHTSPKADAE